LFTAVALAALTMEQRLVGAEVPLVRAALVWQVVLHKLIIHQAGAAVQGAGLQLLAYLLAATMGAQGAKGQQVQAQAAGRSTVLLHQQPLGPTAAAAAGVPLACKLAAEQAHTSSQHGAHLTAPVQVRAALERLERPGPITAVGAGATKLALLREALVLL
jgi:hypothetical protein